MNNISMDTIIYMIFVASIMVGNGIYLGPFTIRQYCAIFFFIYIFINWRNLKGYFKLLLPYLIFIIFYGISSLINNNEEAYIRQFVAHYAVSVVGYFSTIIIMTKYRTYNYFLNSFMVVGLLNVIVNVLQYANIPFGYFLGEIFVDMNDEVKESQFASIVDRRSYYTIGIMGEIVYNGYYSMVLPFVLLLRMKYKNVIIRTCLVLFSLVSLFMVGERSCFIIGLLLLTSYMFLKYRKSIIFYLVCLVLILYIGTYISDLIANVNIRESHYVELSSNVRYKIYSSVIPFISTHLLYGGLSEFIKLTGGYSPHNVIVSGFIYAGIFGGICILYMFIHQMKISWFMIKNNNEILITLAFVSYTLNGLFHNAAIVTGDTMVWILWGMVIFSYKYYKQAEKQCRIKAIQ